MTVPNAKMRFEAGDRLILVVRGDAVPRLRKDLAQW
jgi:hypothetical protein